MQINQIKSHTSTLLPRYQKYLWILSLVLILLLIGSSTLVSQAEESKTIMDDGVPVELLNLWSVAPTVEVTISADLQLTIYGLETLSTPPPGTDPRWPATLGFYIYPDYPEFTSQCLFTPQPYLLTLPMGAVTQQTDGSFELTFNLNDLEQNYCPKSLHEFINSGPFSSRLEVSDNYGNPVLYSEVFVADLSPETSICRVIDPFYGIDQAAEEIYALDLDAGTTDALIEKLSEVEDKLLEDPPDFNDARDKLFNFVYEIEAAVESGALTNEEANKLLNLASGILASLTF